MLNTIYLQSDGRSIFQITQIIFPKQVLPAVNLITGTSLKRTFVKPDGNSAVTSDFVAQSYQLPITATVHYYFKETKLLKPYAGIALGGQYVQQSLYYNVYVSDDDNWGFVARPEVGVIIKPNEYKEWGILIAA